MEYLCVPTGTNGPSNPSILLWMIGNDKADVVQLHFRMLIPVTSVLLWKTLPALLIFSKIKTERGFKP